MMLSKVLLTSALLLVFQGTFAREINSGDTSGIGNMYSLYVGGGSGMNAFTGIAGIMADYRFYRNFHVKMGVGIGSWGFKYSIGTDVDAGKKNGPGAGFYYSYSAGMESINFTISTDAGSNTRKMQFYPTHTVNLAFYYKILIARKHFLQLYTGLGSRIATRTYGQYKILDGSGLSVTEKKLLNQLTPGGFILGLSFMFAL